MIPSPFRKVLRSDLARCEMDALGPTFCIDLLIIRNIEHHKTTYRAGQAVAAGADAPL